MTGGQSILGLSDRGVTATYDTSRTIAAGAVTLNIAL